MVTPRPLAIGFVYVGSCATQRERTAARVQLALEVNERGYALVETFELGLGVVADEVALASAENLARAHEAQVLLVAGAAADARIGALADRVRLVVHELDDAARAAPAIT